MNADEIVATMRKLMPCINDCMDLYEYERQALTQAADLITSQQAEIDRLTALNKEAVELVRLSMEDMRHCADDTGCEVCGNSACTGFGDCNFVWLHADRYEALKKRMEATP